MLARMTKAISKVAPYLVCQSNNTRNAPVNWIEKPPQAVPDVFLRQKMNMRSSENVPRTKSPRQRNVLEANRIKKSIENQGKMNGCPIEPAQIFDPVWRPYSPAQWTGSRFSVPQNKT